MAITTYRSPNGQTFQLHPDAVPVVEPFFNRLNQVYPGYQSAGGYAHRPMHTLDGRNLGGLSTHATGYTLDVKAPDPVLRQMAQEFPHLRWGGKFSHYDPVHFEFGPTAQKYGELPPLNPASLLDPNAAAPTPGPQPPAIAPSGGAAPMTPMQPMTPYSGPSPDDVAQQRRMAQMLMQQATSTEPVGHWTQALARVVQGGVGGMYRNAAQEGEQQGRESVAQLLSGNPTPQALLNNPYTREMGQQLWLAQAKRNMDPTAALQAEKLKMDIEEAKATGPLKRQELEARVKAAGQKDALDQWIMGMISGGGQPNAAAPTMPPQIQPQSFAPTASGQDPNLIRTQAAPTAPPATGEPLVDTPAGRMPESQARKMGFALAMKGRGDAGRMLAEAADKDKLAKEARNEVDKRELNTVEQMGRLTSISNRFDRKYLTLGEKVKQGYMGWKEWLGAQLEPAQQAERSEYVKFVQDTVNNLNSYIKEITGSAMGVEEAARIMSGMPNLSDDPTAFEAKLNNIQSQVLLSMARYRYLRDNGFKGRPWNIDEASRSMSLDQMRKTILDRRDQVASEIKAQFPNAPDNDVRNAIKARIAQEFGISI